MHHKILQTEFTINSKNAKQHNIHFRSKIKSRAKQDMFWSVLGKWENTKTALRYGLIIEKKILKEHNDYREHL